MKTIGLFSLMLAYGIPLPADEKSEFAVFDQLIVDLGDEQSIENDLSTFSSHVTNLRYMMEHAGPKTLVLIDEAGTGTDPAEGAALAQVIFETLTHAEARTIATTHHGSLKVFAHDTPRVENGSMQFDQETLHPTYRLQQGIPGSSYAFEIASRIGLDQALLVRARELLGAQSARLEDLIGSLETRNQRLAQQLDETEKELSSAREERSRYERLFEQLDGQRDEIREKALAEADAVVQEANAQIERTIREIKENQAARDATRKARSELDTFKEKIRKEKQQTEKNQQKRTRRRPPRERETPDLSSNGPLSVGDQVILDGGLTTAELLELDGRDAVIMAGSMHMRVKTDRLTKVAGPRRQQVTIRQVQTDDAGDLGSLKARPRTDLRGQRVDEALANVTRFIDEAMAANLDRVEVVHGKGTGALRQAIHEYLEKSPDVDRFEEAPYAPGISVIVLMPPKYLFSFVIISSSLSDSFFGKRSKSPLAFRASSRTR
jgi:DNA mismatch repair protein MutS2